MNVGRYGARWRRSTVCPSPCCLRTISLCGAHTPDPASWAPASVGDGAGAGEQRPARRRWPTLGRHYGHDHGCGAKSDMSCRFWHRNRDLEFQASPGQHLLHHASGASPDPVQAYDIHKIFVRAPHGCPRYKLDQETTSGGLSQPSTDVVAREPGPASDHQRGTGRWRRAGDLDE
jgi:hypothetical protein